MSVKKMARDSLSGVWTALVTPFKKGEIDWDSLDRLVLLQIHNGVEGLVACGTTAETPALSAEEQDRVVRRVLKMAQNRVKVMIGCGSNSTAKTIELARKYDSWGADAFLVVTPYYNKPTQTGLKEHYRALIRQVKTPVVIYNVPSRTGVNMDPLAVAELAGESGLIAGVKDASGNLDQTSFMRRESPPRFAVLSGEDSLMLPMLSVGACGVVSVASNLAPREMSLMFNAVLKNRWEEARRIHLKLMPLFRALFIETNPAPVKAALWRMGIIESPELRLPLVEMSSSGRIQLDQALASAGLTRKKERSR